MWMVTETPSCCSLLPVVESIKSLKNRCQPTVGQLHDFVSTQGACQPKLPGANRTFVSIATIGFRSQRLSNLSVFLTFKTVFQLRLEQRRLGISQLAAVPHGRKSVSIRDVRHHSETTPKVIGGIAAIHRLETHLQTLGLQGVNRRGSNEPLPRFLPRPCESHRRCRF